LKFLFVIAAKQPVKSDLASSAVCRLHVSSCGGREIEASVVRCMINESARGQAILVEDPAAAELILIVDIMQAGAFANLRANPVWRRWPEKCFAYYEPFNPPLFLHGICTSVPRWKNWFGRFRSFSYPLQGRLYPNPAPEGLLGFERPKQYLFSFVGRRSHGIRRKLFALPWPDDVLVESSHEFYDRFVPRGAHPLLPEEVHYWETMAHSKFALCPRGAGVSSMRLFEAMSIGVAPIIMADAWVPPRGPRWEDFALFVRERDAARLTGVVREHEPEWEDRGRRAYAAYQEHFRPECFWTALAAAISSVRQEQVLPERLFTACSGPLMAMEWAYQAGWRARVELTRLAKRFLRQDLNP
jgi:hypothetical protein